VGPYAGDRGVLARPDDDDLHGVAGGDELVMVFGRGQEASAGDVVRGPPYAGIVVVDHPAEGASDFGVGRRGKRGGLVACEEAEGASHPGGVPA
jgi:hypothetical protein